MVLMAMMAGLAGTTYGLFNAERQRRDAVAQQQRANANALEAKRHAYSASMLSACQALDANQAAVARLHLNAAPESLRGWEWRALTSRLDTSVRALACPMACRGWTPAEDRYANDMFAHPDGKSFFTVRAYETDAVQRWDMQTGRLLARYPRPLATPPTVTSSVFATVSADGRTLKILCESTYSTDHFVVQWDLIGGGATHPSALSTSSSAPQADASEPSEREASLPKLSDHIRRWPSPDGTLLAQSDPRGTVGLFDAKTLKPIRVLRGHANMLTSLVYSIDRQVLATGSLDSTARVWNRADGSELLSLKHPVPVEGVSLSSDGAIVATIGVDRTIRVFETGTGRALGQFTSDRLVLGAVMLTPDGRSVAGRERDGTVRFWDIDAGATVNLRGHRGYLNYALPAPAAGLIVSASWDGWHGEAGSVRLWDAETGEAVASLGRSGEVAYELAVSPDGRQVAAILVSVASRWTPASEENHGRLVLIDLQSGGVSSTAARADARPKRPHGRDGVSSLRRTHCHRNARCSGDPTSIRYPSSAASDRDVRAVATHRGGLEP